MFGKLGKKVLLLINIDVYKKTADRTILEKQILPWLAARLDKVLFVGCDWYTRGYRKFFDKQSYWTMDFDPDKAAYGSDLHIQDSMTKVAEYFDPASMDLVVCNGVFGWGLDQREDVEAAFDGVADILRPGGLFLIGWNRIEPRCPFPLDSVTALERFEPQIIDPFGRAEVEVDTDFLHVFSLYAKK